MLFQKRNFSSRDRWKQEVHDQTLVGKVADLATFGISVTRAVRALALECSKILTALSKREEASSGTRKSKVKFWLSIVKHEKNHLNFQVNPGIGERGKGNGSF